MMNYFCSLLYTLLLYGSTYSEGNTSVILQRLNSQSRYNATCAITGEAMGSAISWITNIPSKSSSITNIVSVFIPNRNSPFNCNINRNYEKCKYYWTDNMKWVLQNSLNSFLGPVLDRRWEEFDTIHTDGSLTFKEIATLSNYKKFQLHISIRTVEAHIYLCDYGYPPSGKCYWILLGAWNGNRTAIRKCEAYYIPKVEKSWPKDPCYTLRGYMNHTNETIIKTTHWSHFTIRRNNDNILLYKIGDLNPILNYTDTDGSLFDTRYVLGLSRNKIPGYWRVHNYDYSITNEAFVQKLIGEEMPTYEKVFCASFFVAMCTKCKLVLEILYYDGTERNYEVIKQIIIASKENKAWQEEKITAQLRGVSAQVRLRATGICDECKNPFWALDYFQLCSENEIRVSTGSLELYETTCEVIKSSLQVKYSELKTDNRPETSCGNGMFGKACFVCSDIFGTSKFNCEKSIICEIEQEEQNVCRCSKGYRGNTCEDSCPVNKYGYECQETCGHCTYSPCDFVSGICAAYQCMYSFGGPQCKTPPSPLLRYPPTLLRVDHTTVTVQLQNRSYDGNQIPIFYKIQHKKLNQTEWENSGQIDFNNQVPIQITRLSVLTSYLIRAILITASNTSFEAAIVPSINITTTCEFIQKESISIETFNTSALLTFKSSEDACPSSVYRLQIGSQTVTSETFTFKITDLKPFIVYNARLSSEVSGDFEINLDFQTEEGAPEKVNKLNSVPIGDSTLKISWNPPSVPNGMIRYYEVTYEHTNYLGCPPDGKISNSNSQRTLRELSNVTRITNLIPYSQYKIHVVPFTTMMGEQSSIITDTQPSETPNEAEVPSIQTVKSESTKINIFMNPPNCTSVRGLLDYYVTFSCHNSWCTAQSPTTLNFSSISFQKPLVLTNLLPYSNYTVTINVGRKNGKMSPTIGMVAVVNTEISVPNLIKDIVIFSKNESSISFRFPPPYPPTGILNEIFLNYCYEEVGTFYTTNNCKSLYVPLVQCQLWSSYFCTTVTELNPKTEYHLLVRVKNNGTNFNEPTRAVGTTIQEAPEAPQNLSATWDDYYNLTLSWTHPGVTNGPLTQFLIKIYAHNGICLDRSIPITEEAYQLSYRYDMKINESCYSSKLTIYVHSYNIMRSPGLTLENFSPPTTPNMPKPNILTITNATISLDLRGVSNLEDTVEMYIIVSSNTDTGPDRKVKQTELWKKAGIPKEFTSWLVADLNVTSLKSSENAFTIGNDLTSTSTHLQIEIHNRPLLPSTDYIITILLINNFNRLKRHSVHTLNATTMGSKIEQGSSNYSLFALLLLLLIPVIIWIAISYHRKKKAINWNTLVTMVSTGGRGSTNPDVIPLTTDKVSSQSNTLSPVNSIKKPEIAKKTTNVDRFSKPIKIVEFENYVKESIANGELERQHQLFPRGQTKPWDYGILPQNKSKNRYNNLIAYDHSRVKLEKINGDEFSDYINANYIDGYKTSKGYIATQGPKPATVVDFWRMIWQENVNYIVMLANVIEGGKKKTEQYWPNVRESLVYGDIQVDYLNSEIYADFEYRTFTVQCNNEERTIEQLHFVSWPDHGVPLYSQSLVPFLRKLLTIPQGKAPVVVHCSAGVGRTGTIILCDLCLRMAAREGVVDVLKHQHNLRQQRANLVDNVEQYKLAHLVLLECLIAPQTNLPCDDSIAKSIEKIIQSNSLQHHMEYLKNTEWQDHAMQASLPTAPEPQWATKNRFQDIVPSAYGRVYISRYPVSDEHSDYINAVEVDGFRAPQRFIATQQPLPHTVSDFWRMVDEKEVTTIISLNRINKDDLESCIFWPTEKVEEIKPVPYLKLRFHNKTKHENYAIITLHLYNNKNKKSNKRTVNLISFKRWPSNKIIPDNKDDLLKLWEETDRVSRGNKNPIIVTCHNGATACGLFLALTFLIEKILLEQQCDVCLAVRAVRRNRKQFVNEKDQFIFLYQSALLYLSGFSLYSNFSPASTSNN